MIDKKMVLTLDTETASLVTDVFDVGYTIADKSGNVVCERSALVREVFSNQRKMRKAFYYDKVFTEYLPMLERGEIVIRPWMDIVAMLRADIQEHGVNVLSAFNLGFDKRVMTNTHKEHGDGRPVLPRKVDLLDIWLFSCQVKINTQGYKTWARATGAVSPAGNYRSNAESVYRYVMGLDSFEEKHTALADARIETEILASCFRRKRKIPYNVLIGNPWKLIQD